MHNVFSIEFIDEEKKKKILSETVNVFLPILSLAKIPLVNNFQKIIQNKL
jgi:hypothetical protein